MNFKTTIGLEVHVELKTNSKIYSPAPNEFGDEPNLNTNVIDWGYPGVLPSVNKGVVRDGIMAALALHAKVEKHNAFDRKNYFYPDSPKGYQITQSRKPIAHDGWLDITTNGKTHRVGIAEMHIEEDAGKNTHLPNGYSYVDLNRQGTPLIEIVSKPDIESPDEAVAYLQELRKRIQFTGISDVKMEEGSMRVDVNISVRPYGSDKLGVRSEIKNLNSFNFIHNTLEYEIKRHQQVLMRGDEVVQETRRYDEATGGTLPMRGKAGSDDYRYFPEPDLPALDVSDDWIQEIKDAMPEMPNVRRKHYVDDLGISDYDADVLTQTKEMSDFFDDTVKLGADPKRVANYLMNDVNSYLNDHHVDLQDTKLTPEHLAGMIKLISDGTISTKMAKKVFTGILAGEEPAAYAKAHGLVQLSDPKQLQPMVDDIVAKNHQSVVDYHNGKDRALGFLMGQVMKQTRGKANPQIVTKLLKQALDEAK